MEQQNNSLALAEQQQLPTIGLDQMDSLEEAQAAPIDLMSDYWTPEVPGESKRVIFDRIETTHVPDQTTGEAIELDCAFFFVKEDGQVKRIRNGSKRLVGALLNVPPRAPLLIKYLGKKRNKNNAMSSDNWSITPLIYGASAK